MKKIKKKLGYVREKFPLPNCKNTFKKLASRH